MRLALALCLVVSFAGSAIAQERQPTLQATHGSWEFYCNLNAVGQQDCFLFQAASNPGETERVMTAFVAKPAGEEPLLRLTVPLGVFLPAGLNMQVDGFDLGTVSYVACFSNGCMTQINLDHDLADRMKAGIQATVTIGDPFGQIAQIPLSLSGFTAGWNSF
ncbi:MAG: invasion associated locus B family protein [Rhodospirillales bacterium]|nr:invasion associated locus B family protein [Rhodospirillales bacterium]